MKRTRLQSDDPVYDRSSDAQRIESKLTTLCILAGLDVLDLDLVTIDEIVDGLRSNFYYSSPSATSFSHAAIDFLRSENYHLVTSARRYWWHRQLIKGVSSRG